MFEIGKTYKSKNGCDYIVVAKHPDGRLVTEAPGASPYLVYRNADGSCSWSDAYSLIDPDAVSSEDRQRLSAILDALGMKVTASKIARGNSDKTGYIKGSVKAAVEIMNNARSR